MLLSEVYDRCTWKSGLLGMQDYLDYVEVYDRCIVNPIIARPAKMRIFFDGYLWSCKNPRWICGENDPTNTELALSLSDRSRFPRSFIWKGGENDEEKPNSLYRFPAVQVFLTILSSLALAPTARLTEIFDRSKSNRDASSSFYSAPDLVRCRTDR